MVKGRILWVENNYDFLSGRSEFIEKAGYQVLKAFSIEEAERILQNSWVHLVILDMRLRDDYDEWDKSGLDWAENETYRFLPKIILTSYATKTDTRRALRTGPNDQKLAQDVWDKDEEPEKMVENIEAAFAQLVHSNLKLDIHWEAVSSFFHLASLIKPNLKDARLLERATELEDLFRRLFYDSSQITIIRLFSTQKNRIALALSAFSENGTESQFVVAFGQREVIRREAANYDKFAPKTMNTRNTAKYKFVETVHFAAIAYTLTGADWTDITPLDEFYRENSAERVMAALDDLFNTTLTYWRQQATHFEEQARLNEAFRACAQVSPALLGRSELEPPLQAMQTEALKHGLTRLDETLLKLWFDLLEGTLTIEASLRSGIIHRRFRDNILVDHQGRTWLSDFSQIVEGPLVYDYVALETTIKFDLLTTGNLDERRKMENYLQSNLGVNEESQFDNLEPDVKKALQVINHLRQQAKTVIGQEIKPYQVGLLFRTVEALTPYKLDIHYPRSELSRYLHSFLAMGMLCQKLDLPDEEGSLFIDRDNKEVKVDGKLVKLTKQQFKLLIYLEDNQDRVCSRDELLDYLYQEETDERWPGALDAHIFRLRKKIEPDLANPRYIITVPGHGYRLVK